MCVRPKQTGGSCVIRPENDTGDTGHGTRDTGHGARDTGHGTRDGRFLKNKNAPARQRTTPELPALKKVVFLRNKNAPARQRTTPEPLALKKRPVCV